MSTLKRNTFDSVSMEVVESKRAKNAMVSFSKRRQGLFRKASELCSKFDAQIAILVLSPSENPFSFGHSSVDDVIRRYDSLLGQTTTAAVGEEGSAVNERMRQESELEALRARVKKKERVKRESALNPNNTDNSLINVENCESIEELEGFKVKCLALLQLIREKQRNDLSFVDSGTASGSGSFNLLHNQQNDMPFPVVRSESDPGFTSVAAGSVMTMVDHQPNGNDVPFSLPKYGGSSGGWGFGTVGGGSPEVMVDQQNYLSPTDGSSGGFNNNDSFRDQMRFYGIGGDENLGFCRYENNLLHGQQNDMSFWKATCDDNNFGAISTDGFGP